MNEKLNVAVLFGGCSDEYSVSLHSAAGVLRALDPGRYTVVKIGIDPQGRLVSHKRKRRGNRSGPMAYSVGSAAAADVSAQGF